MLNKFLIVLIGLLLVFYVAGLLLAAASEFSSGPRPINPAIAEILALIMMMINGTFMSWRFYKVIYLIGGGIVFGAILKILHLPGADEILLLSYLLMPLLYSIYFLTKKQKQLLDWLKLVCVWSYFIIAALSFLRVLQRGSWIEWVSFGLFWVTFVYFITDGVKQKKLFVHKSST